MKVIFKLIQLNLKKANEKLGRRPAETFFQRRDTDGQQVHEKMLNIINQRNVKQNHKEVSPHTCQNDHQINQRNVKQNHKEVSPHTCQNDHHQKDHRQQCWQGCGEKRILYTVAGNVK